MWLQRSWRCTLCGAQTRTLQAPLCELCFLDLPSASARCQRCGLPTGEAVLVCGGCLNKDWPLVCTVVLGDYAWPLKEWIVAFKHHQHLHYGPLLAACLLERLHKEAAPQRIDALIPMPLHPGRLRARGFNQASEIARILGQRLKKPILWEGARRCQATAPQAKLSAQERVTNMAGAFLGMPCAAGQRLAIVDDVITTGATVRALAEALYRSGAASVEAWCLARA